MSQTNQLVSKAIELQQNTLENSQRAMERAMEIPIKGTVDFQRNAAQLMLDGLEMGNWVSNQSVELTRNALDTYLTTVEDTARETTQMAERGMEQARDAGQQGLASTGQFATGAAGNGSQVEGSGTSLAGASRQPGQAQSQPQAGAQYQPPAPSHQQAPPAQQQAPAQQSPPQQQTPPAQQSPPQQQASPQQQAPVAGQHQQSPASFQQQPAPQQPPAAANQPPAPQQQSVGGQVAGQGGQWTADQQGQAPPAQPLPEFQSDVTTRPPATFQAQPPQPPREAPAEQREAGVGALDGQKTRQGRVDENESNAAEAPADTP